MRWALLDWDCHLTMRPSLLAFVDPDVAAVSGVLDEPFATAVPRSGTTVGTGGDRMAEPDP